MQDQKSLFLLDPIEADIVYTPESVAVEIIKWVKPSGKCLDPCAGDFVFWKNMPAGSDWCEIREDKDFFEYDDELDWVIGNPPYSIFEEFLKHSFDISKNVVFIVPTNKVFQRLKIMEMINTYGGIKGIKLYGSGSNVGFPFGFSTGTFHFQKGYCGDCSIVFP